MRGLLHGQTPQDELAPHTGALMTAVPQDTAAGGQHGSSDPDLATTASPQDTARDPQDLAPDKPTFEQLLEAMTPIMHDRHFTAVDIRDADSLMARFADESRALGYRAYNPTWRQLESTAYRVIDMVLPHGSTPEPGSAGDLLVRRHIRPDLGEYGFMHDRNMQGGQDHCEMQVLVRVVQD